MQSKRWMSAPPPHAFSTAFVYGDIKQLSDAGNITIVMHAMVLNIHPPPQTSHPSQSPTKKSNPNKKRKFHTAHDAGSQHDHPASHADVPTSSQLTLPGDDDTKNAKKHRST
jgi:hypothetical protein